jgi:REP element-mobilizing transposase RayT
MLQEGFFDRRKPLVIRWGELPHWRQDGASYFVTFRLADSLPASKLLQWRREREQWMKQHRDRDSDSLRELLLGQMRVIERWLDRGVGSCLLGNRDAHDIVAQAMQFFDGSRYELGDTAVAGNHVHALLRTASGIDLSEILSSWKRFTSREIRKLPIAKNFRGGSRHLWQTESFDHIVRDQSSLEKFSAYIKKHRL